MLIFKFVRMLTAVAATAVVGVPQIASAATFDGLGAHTLTSLNLGLTANLGGVLYGFSCTDSALALVVTNATTANVTGASFSHCTGAGAIAGVPFHMTGTGFPWRVTALASGTFAIDGIHVTQVFTLPSGPLDETLEGSLEGTINNTTHVATFANAEGLTATGGLGTGAATVSGTFSDSLSSLAVT